MLFYLKKYVVFVFLLAFRGLFFLKVPRKNNYQRRLRRWHSISGKCTHQAETLLHSLKRAATGIGLHVNAHKIEYMSFNQTGDISTLKGSSLKIGDKFTYLGSSVSSTEIDIDTWLVKAWTAIGYMEVRPDR